MSRANAAYFECFSGVSGNMILGALLDAGLTFDDLQAELKKLNVSGFDVRTTRVVRQGIAAVHVEVQTEETHAHRHLHHIRAIIEQSDLDQPVKDESVRVFTRLAEAEAAVHNTTVEHIHFHEVGALDAIVDIVGAVAGLRKLGIENIYVSPFHLGTGFTTCAHGTIPVPVPATISLLKGKPVRYTDIDAELVTPTGAAILSTLGKHFGSPPPIRFDAIGYGAGTRERSIPNVLRLHIGTLDSSGGEATDTISVIEANIDDMNPEFYEYLFEKLYEAGALEVYTAPVIMKKTRAGTVLTVLSPPSIRTAIAQIMLRETTTIGVRWRDMQRIKASREMMTVDTDFGTVRVKVSRLDGEVVNITPEYDDCKKQAQKLHVPLKRIYQAAVEQGSRQIR